MNATLLQALVNGYHIRLYASVRRWIHSQLNDAFEQSWIEFRLSHPRRANVFALPSGILRSLEMA